MLGDRTIPHWFAAHRTSNWSHWSLISTILGATTAILIVSFATWVVFLAVTRHWRPVIFIVTVMFGELAAFLAAAIVKRPRPDVPHLDQHLPTSAYLSGHTAAICCLYIAVAILVIGHAHGWWRWLLFIPAFAMPILVATSRMYRGEHHPTDIVGSLIFSALRLAATSVLMKPEADIPPGGASCEWREPRSTALAMISGRLTGQRWCRANRTTGGCHAKSAGAAARWCFRSIRAARACAGRRSRPGMPVATVKSTW